VYIGSLGGSVYALDAATGEARWIVEIGGRVASSPTVAGGVVYVGNNAEDYYDGGHIYALGAEDGGLRWRFEAGEWVGTSSPAIANGTLYVGTVEGTLFALE
jgi:outer membrane protein assembly factor BamB